MCRAWRAELLLGPGALPGVWNTLPWRWHPHQRDRILNLRLAYHVRALSPRAQRFHSRARAGLLDALAGALGDLVGVWEPRVGCYERLRSVRRRRPNPNRWYNRGDADLTSAFKALARSPRHRRYYTEAKARVAALDLARIPDCPAWLRTLQRMWGCFEFDWRRHRIQDTFAILAERRTFIAHHPGAPRPPLILAEDSEGDTLITHLMRHARKMRTVNRFARNYPHLCVQPRTFSAAQTPA